MGNERSKTQQNIKDYSPLKNFVIDPLGTVTVYKHQTEGHVKIALLTSYSIGNKALAESEIEQLKRVNTLPQICKLIKHDVVKNQMLCLENFSLHLIFEAFPSSLGDCISQQKHFPEQELWAMAESTLFYLSGLKSLGLSDGDLQPKSIFYVPGSTLKFLNMLLFTNYQCAYKMKLAYRPYNSTFAPELMQQLKNCVPNPEYDLQKADVFSMGICLLCAATSTPFEHFYNFHDCSILQEKIQNKLAAMVEKGYSTELFSFIDSCVLMNPFERPFLDVLYKKLPGAALVTSSAAFWGR